MVTEAACFFLKAFIPSFTHSFIYSFNKHQQDVPFVLALS